MRVTVRVPASVANLGPGFDILALALQLQNELRAETAEDGIEVDPGADAGDALRDPAHNLVVRGYRAVAAELGVTPHPARMTCNDSVPVGRGLGSSAAATVAGVLAGVALHQAPWDEQQVLDVAARIEGHRDNAAAALLGGLVVCAPGAPTVHIDVPDRLYAVVLAPHTPLLTSESRAVVPTSFTRDDAMYNAARCALLVRAITTADTAMLRLAMEDRWHQAARLALIPWAARVIDAAREVGAGAALAGAGPSVVALTCDDPEPVRDAMLAAAHDSACAAECMVLRPRGYGARVDMRP